MTIQRKTVLSLLMSLALIIMLSLSLFTNGGNVSAAVQYTYYASPTGSGSICSLQSPCSLTGVQSKVRTVNTNMTGDIVVNLLGGTYSLTATWQFTQLDSGSNGFNVIYQAMDGQTPILSGGTTITGWTLVDSVKNIYRSNVGTVLDSRQLYVNGVRATRAKGDTNPAGFTKTTTGFTAPSSGIYAAMNTWGNPAKIELVSFNRWKSFRCPVTSIVGTAITMQNNCWTNAQVHTGVTMDVVTWIENAYELLDSQGEWYLDRATGFLYYIPITGENISTATVIAPVLETLLSGTGSLTSKIKNIQFTGITFAYATWLAPNTSEGYVSVQAGYHLTGTGNTVVPPGDTWTRTPGNVTFSAANNIVIKRNLFTHLGMVGLNFEYGSQFNNVIGNRFDDISSSGVQVGDTTDYATTDENRKSKYNSIQNNYIINIGKEYHDSIGISTGYNEHLTISHNEIANIPYSGISVGWGWGRNSYAQFNDISYNYIHDVMQTLQDGGAIYTLSAQPNSTIKGNYLQYGYADFGAIYPDEGSAYFNINNNVVKQPNNWLYMWNNSVHDNIAQHNYSDTANIINACTNCTVNSNTTVTNGIWPTAAINIMDNAGIEPAYRDIKNSFYTNVALSKTVSASSVYGSGYEANKGNDFSNSTGWSPTGTDPTAWWQVDLGAAYTIAQINLVTRQGIDQPVTRQNFEIRASNDPTFATYTVLGSQGSTPLAYQATWTANISNGNSFRYVRAAKTVNEYFWVSELQVMGYINVALSKTASASSVYGVAGYEANKGNDGSNSTGWSPTGTDTAAWWQVDLGVAHSITQVNLVTRQGIDQPVTRQNFEIRASNDPTFATYTILGSQGSEPLAYQATFSAYVNNGNSFRYIRAAKTVSEYFYLSELQVVGNVNLAYAKLTSASTVFDVAGYEENKGNDGSISTGWSPLGMDTLPWWQVDLGAAYTITQIDLVTRQDYDQSMTRQNFEIRASNDPAFATYTVLGSQPNIPIAYQATWSAKISNMNTFRYIRATKTTNEYFYLSEFRVTGY